MALRFIENPSEVNKGKKKKKDYRKKIEIYYLNTFFFKFLFFLRREKFIVNNFLRRFKIYDFTLNQIVRIEKCVFYLFSVTFAISSSVFGKPFFFYSK